MSLFDEMLSIKQYRESQAQRHFLVCQRIYQESDQAYQTAQKNLAEFQEMARLRELDLYNNLCNRSVRRQDVEYVYASVTILREHEKQYCDRLLEQRAEREQAMSVMVQAREDLRQAQRNVEKFLELVDLYSLEADLERERKDDNDMEEVAAISWGRAKNVEPEQKGMTEWP